MSRFAGLYTVQETAERAHLAPSTLQVYARGRANLIRGVDFLVRREGKWCRRLYFTERGLHRLSTRAYRVGNSGVNDVPFRVVVPPFLTPPSVHDYDRRARNRRYLSIITQVLDLYSKSPCAVPDCPCITHKLGLPRLDEMLEAVLQPRDISASETVRRRKNDSMGG